MTSFIFNQRDAVHVLSEISGDWRSFARIGRVWPLREAGLKLTQISSSIVSRHDSKKYFFFAEIIAREHARCGDKERKVRYEAARYWDEQRQARRSSFTECNISRELESRSLDESSTCIRSRRGQCIEVPFVCRSTPKASMAGGVAGRLPMASSPLLPTACACTSQRHRHLNYRRQPISRFNIP